MGLMLQYQSYPAESGSAQLYSFRVVTVINHEVHMMVTPYDDQNLFPFADGQIRQIGLSMHLYSTKRSTLIVQKTESITSDGSCRQKCRVQHHIYADTVKGKQKVKADIALHGNPISRATGRHLPYGITQCYLPPDTSESAPPNPSHAACYSIYLPRGDGRLRLS